MNMPERLAKAMKKLCPHCDQDGRGHPEEVSQQHHMLADAYPIVIRPINCSSDNDDTTKGVNIGSWECNQDFGMFTNDVPSNLLGSGWLGSTLDQQERGSLAGRSRIA